MELRLLLAAIRRGAAILVIALIAGAVGGAAVYMALPSHYVASSSLLVDSSAILVPGQQPFTGDPERYINDQMRLMTSEQVAQQVAALVPGFTSQDVTAAISLAHVTGTNAVTVTATASTPSAAQELANGVATTYLADRQAPAKRVIAAQSASLQQQLNALAMRIYGLRGAASAAGEQAALLTQYNALLTQQAQLTAPGATKDSTAVTQAAALPTSSVRSISAFEAVGGAAFAALLAAFAFVLIREMRRPHVMTKAHAEVVLGRDVAASLTTGSHGRGTAGQESEELHRLATVVSSSPSSQPKRTVVVCSAVDDSTTASVVRKLAGVLSAQGHGVAVVDLMAAPTGPQGWRTPSTAADSRGLATVGGRAAPPAVGGVSHFSAITESGVWSTNARDYAGALQGHFDVVIVQTPSVLRSGVAAPVSRTADDTILVVPLGEQLEGDLRLSYQVLREDSLSRIHVVTCNPIESSKPSKFGRGK